MQCIVLNFLNMIITLIKFSPDLAWGYCILPSSQSLVSVSLTLIRLFKLYEKEEGPELSKIGKARSTEVPSFAREWLTVLPPYCHTYKIWL